MDITIIKNGTVINGVTLNRGAKANIPDAQANALINALAAVPANQPLPPVGTSPQITRNADGSASGLIDPATGQPLGGGGGSTVARAVAKALHFSTARRFSLDNHELLALPPTWSSKAYFEGQTVKSTDGKTFWILEFFDGGTGTSTVEPTRNPITPYSTVKMSDGGVWTPFDAANYRITTNPGLYDASKTVINFTTTFGQTYNFAPVDASASPLTRRYQGRDCDSGLNPSTYVAARIARAGRIYSPGAFYDTIYGDSGQYQSLNVVAGVYYDNISNQVPFCRFYTKAKSVAIGILSTSSGGVAPNGNILIDGVAVSFMSLDSHPSVVTGQTTLYQFNFLDERERCFEITNNIWPSCVFTSSNQDIYRDSRRELNILSFGDSTMAGAAPGPHNKICGPWGCVVGWELGIGPGVFLGNGGIGYIHYPTTQYIQSGNKGYNFIERWYKNRTKLDTRQGAQSQNIILFDIVGWDVDDGPTLTIPGITFQPGHTADPYVINSASRRATFSAWLADVVADQPTALLVFVMPRDNASTAGLDVNGNVVPDGAGTANGNVGLMAVLDDWLYAIDAVVPSTSRLIVNLADMQYNTNDRNAPTVFSYKEGSPHTTTWHHVQKGKYVAQQIVRNLTARI